VLTENVDGQVMMHVFLADNDGVRLQV